MNVDSEGDPSSGTGRAATADDIVASVVLCTRNRAARLPTALQSLEAMKFSRPVNWECLVVDNGSTDDTRAVVETFAARRPEFRYVSEPRPGKTYALNTGIAAARGSFLAFTDDDAIVAPAWLQAIIDNFTANGADGVGGKVSPVWLAERPSWLADDLVNTLALLDWGDRPFQLDWSKGRRMLYGVNFAFRKDLLEQVGAFNTTLGSRGEDQELFDRLAGVGARVFYDPAVSVQHIIPAERLTKAYYRDWYRAGGRARAKSKQQGRQLLGVPLYVIRQYFETLGRLGKALVSFDGAQIFRCWLWSLFFTAFCTERVASFWKRGRRESA